jgi:hypothetical protein
MKQMVDEMAKWTLNHAEWVSFFRRSTAAKIMSVAEGVSGAPIGRLEKHVWPSPSLDFCF